MVAVTGSQPYSSHNQIQTQGLEVRIKTPYHSVMGSFLVYDSVKFANQWLPPENMQYHAS
eukprot:5908544-Pyramimonas_sp.AAC.1